MSKIIKQIKTNILISLTKIQLNINNSSNNKYSKIITDKIDINKIFNNSSNNNNKEGFLFFQILIIKQLITIIIIIR